MQSTSRAGPHLLLGVFTVLALGAVLLSLETAPPNAQEQLQQAAKATIAAGSFVLDDTFTVVPSSPAAASEARTETADVIFHAPDQVRETYRALGRTQTALVLGPSRWVRRDSGHWVFLGSEAANVPTGLQAAAGILGPFQVVTGAVEVVRHGDSYSFRPASGQLSALLAELLGPKGAQLSPRSVSFAATVSGEFLHSFDLTAVVSGARVLVHLALGSFDRAPVLMPPRY
jgi:hypothetical protein